MKDIQSTGKVKALFLLMRPFQWVKNIILFLPMFFAQEIGDTDRLWNVAILFAGFCLLTSGVYIFNDLMDAGEDRLHPGQTIPSDRLPESFSDGRPCLHVPAICDECIMFQLHVYKQHQIWLLSRRIYPPELSLYALPQTGTDHRCHDCRLRFHHPA